MSASVLPELKAVQHAPPERRAAHRFSVLIPGRYAFEGGPEHSCVTENISWEGAFLRGLVIPTVDTEIVCDLRGVGRISGSCVRHTKTGFVLSVQASSLPIPRLVAKLREIATEQEQGAPYQRGFERLVPRQTETFLTLANGTSYEAAIVNLSPSGVALATEAKPSIGTVIFVGNTAAKVVRHSEAGVAAAFLRLITIDEVTTEIVL
jgi:hypothetical protein